MKAGKRNLLIAAAESALLALGLGLGTWTCFKADNPFRAGDGASPGILTIPHESMLLGVGHADHFCDPMNYCAACHGANLQGGSNGAPSCTRCHGDLWSRDDCGRGLHTVNMKGAMHAPNFCRPLENCAACHGADLKGGTSGEPSCFSCHSDRWNRKDCGRNIHTVNLGGVFHAADYCRPYQNCTECHGSNLRGGPDGEPSCLKCHDQKKWMNCGTIQHNQSQDGVRHASGLCKPYENCAFCHGQDLKGGPNNEPSCTRCHGAKWTESDCGRDN